MWSESALVWFPKKTHYDPKNEIGASEGIRTLDVHLGNVIAINGPTWTQWDSNGQNQCHKTILANLPGPNCPQVPPIFSTSIENSIESFGVVHRVLGGAAALREMVCTGNGTIVEGS